MKRGRNMDIIQSIEMILSMKSRCRGSFFEIKSSTSSRGWKIGAKPGQNCRSSDVKIVSVLCNKNFFPTTDRDPWSSSPIARVTWDENLSNASKYHWVVSPGNSAIAWAKLAGLRKSLQKIVDRWFFRLPPYFVRWNIILHLQIRHLLVLSEKCFSAKSP